MSSSMQQIPRIVEEARMPLDLDRQIRVGLCVCFPADWEIFIRTRAWHGSSPAYSVVIEAAGQVLAHAGVVDRVISAGGKEVRVAGVQNVFVLPAHRGSGMFYAVMDAAMHEAQRRGFDSGLLFCAAQLEPLYQRCGWRALGGREVTRIDEPGSEAPLPGGNIVMFYPLRLAALPPGPIHLCGNDW